MTKPQKIRIAAEIILLDYPHEEHDDLISAAEELADMLDNALSLEISESIEDGFREHGHHVSAWVEDADPEEWQT
jgi:hypothetical protein